MTNDSATTEPTTKQAPNYKALVTNALVQIDKLQRKLDTKNNEQHEPIAIVGMGCRYPGGINNPEDYWEALTQGKDCIEDANKRWGLEHFYDPDPSVPGKFYSRHLGMMDNIGDFDSNFFGISPREAESMDPQQRILLEVSWHALEQAGCTIESLKGSKTSVFAGIATQDYSFVRSRFSDLDAITPYEGTGNALSVATGRISYLLGLTGPSVSVETACSSSLVSLHLAIQSLRTKESDMALAGGVSLILNPATSVVFSKAMLLSPSGRCATFDKSADGYVRAEGCGMIVLKRLSDAKKAGDNVLAVIRGSAVNQDGRSQGITAPNEIAQTQVIQAALANARVSPEKVEYVEAHGTGTALGDPIEINALASIFSGNHDNNTPLKVGSVKTNIGHSETAAGIAGVIKVALALQHKKIPQQLHFDTPNPHIAWKDIPIKIVDQATGWNKDAPIAGVSSFGFSGTNAHVIMQGLPEVKKADDDNSQGNNIRVNNVQSNNDNELMPLTLSARHPDSLKQLAQEISSVLSQKDNISTLASLCHSTNQSRSGLSHRLTVLGKNANELQKNLSDFVEGKESSDIFSSITWERLPKITFLFSAVNAKLFEQGKDLYQHYPAFKISFDKCDAVLSNKWGISLKDILWGDRSEFLSQAQYSVVATCVLQIASTDLWFHLGIKPNRLLGNGTGEYAAAYCAGVLSQEDTLHLVIARTTGSDYKSIAEKIHYNKPRFPFISCQTGKLANSEISHSDYWVTHQEKRNQLSDAISTLKKVRMDVLIEMGSGSVMLDLARESLEFNVKKNKIHYLPTLLNDKDEQFQLLSSLVQLHHNGSVIQWKNLYPKGTQHNVVLPRYPFYRTLHWFELSEEQSALYKTKLDVMTNASPATELSTEMSTPSQVHLATPLPTRPDNIFGSDYRPLAHGQNTSIDHPLFSKIIKHSLFDEAVYEIYLDPKHFPLLKQHKVFNEIVVAGGFYISAIFSALMDYSPNEQWEISDLSLLAPILLDLDQVDEPEISILNILIRKDDQLHIELSTLVADKKESSKNKTVHVTCIATENTEGSPENYPLEALSPIKNNATIEFDRENFYSELQNTSSIFHGADFQWNEKVWFDDNSNKVLSNLHCPPSIAEDGRIPIHTGLIDSCFQSIAAIGLGQRTTTLTAVPKSIESFKLYHTPKADKLWCLSTVREFNENNAIIDIQLINERGEKTADITGFNIQQIDKTLFLQAISPVPDTVFYETQWQLQKPSLVSTDIDASNILVCVGSSENGKEVRESLGEVLSQRSNKCIIAQQSESYQRINDLQYQLDFRASEQVKLLFTDLTTMGLTIDRVIHCLGMEAASLPLGLSSIRLNCLSLLNVVQQVKLLTVTDDTVTLPSLGIVTQGAQVYELGKDQENIAASTLWGMAKTICLEYPELNTQIVDFGGDSPYLEEVAHYLLFQKQESQLILRNKTQFIPRLHAVEFKEQPSALAYNSSCNKNDVYLITGGLGALGLETAEWLISNGIKNIALCGRSLPNEEALLRITQWTKSSVYVTTYQTDISDNTQVRELIDTIQQNGNVLKGIYHEAGIISDALISQQYWEDYAVTFAPKIQGAINLHSTTLDVALDQFVCFSSISSVLGNAGQANYAAANAFIDQLMQLRRQQGLPGTAINWGPWGDVGLATRMDTQSHGYFEKLGITPITTAEGFEYLSQALSMNNTQLAVLPVQWFKFFQHWPGVKEHGFLQEIGQHFTKSIDLSQLNHPFIEKMKGYSNEQRIDEIVEYVHKKLSNVLSKTSVDVDLSLLQMGIDSLMAIEFKTQLTRELALELPVHILLEGPSIQSLAEYLSSLFTEDYFEKVATGEINTSEESMATFDTSALLDVDQSMIEIEL